MKNTNKTNMITLWLSFVLQGTITAFLFLGAITNIVRTDDALSNSRQLGYAESTLLPLAIFLICSLILYVINRTSILGALLLTAWFGGATATHIIHGDSLGILISPIVFAVIVWIAPGIRSTRFRSFISIQKAVEE